MFENEECWVLMGRRIGSIWHARYDRYTVGQPAAVRFDPDYIWDNRKRIIGWLHTHPSFSATPSSTDNSTMKACVCSLGKPLLCCIRGIDGLRAWWYWDDESPGVEGKIIKVGGKLMGWTR